MGTPIKPVFGRQQIYYSNMALLCQVFFTKKSRKFRHFREMSAGKIPAAKTLQRFLQLGILADDDIGVGAQDGLSGHVAASTALGVELGTAVDAAQRGDPAIRHGAGTDGLGLVAQVQDARLLVVGNIRRLGGHVGQHALTAGGFSAIIYLAGAESLKTM